MSGWWGGGRRGAPWGTPRPGPGRHGPRAAAHLRAAHRGGPGARLPPVHHAGTARRLARPQAPTEHTRGERGQKTGHPVKHVRLLNAGLTLLLLRETAAGSTHEKRRAEAHPSPWPAASRWLPELGCLAFTLDHVESLMPTQQPRGRALTRAQTAAHRRLAPRRVRIAPVNSRVKRCRMVHDPCRLRKAGVRETIMDICCAWQHFRVRLSPWQPMV